MVAELTHNPETRFQPVIMPDSFGRISKKELAVYFGYFSNRAGQVFIRTERLRVMKFTDSVLSEVGISADEYARTRIFDRATTARIIHLFHLNLPSHESLHKIQPR